MYSSLSPLIVYLTPSAESCQNTSFTKLDLLERVHLLKLVLKGCFRQSAEHERRRALLFVALSKLDIFGTLRSIIVWLGDYVVIVLKGKLKLILGI